MTDSSANKDDGRYESMRLLEAICPQSTVQTVIVMGEPIPKERPRFSKRGKPYTTKKTTEGEHRIALMLCNVERLKGNVSVSCIFYRSNRYWVDVDNLLKAVLDAGARARIWRDDSQVTALIGILEYDKDNPRTVISLGCHNSSMIRDSAAPTDRPEEVS